MNKIKMKEHFQGTGVPMLSVGQEVPVGSGGVSLELAKWLVENGKATDISVKAKVVEKKPEPKPEPEEKSAPAPKELGVMTSEKVGAADKFGGKGKKK